MDKDNAQNPEYNDVFGPKGDPNQRLFAAKEGSSIASTNSASTALHINNSAEKNRRLSHIITLQDAIDYHKFEIARLTEEIGVLQNKIHQLDEEIAEIDQELKTCCLERDQIMRRAEAGKSLEGDKERSAKLDKNIGKLENRQEEKTAEKHACTDQCSTLEKERSGHEQELDKLDPDHDHDHDHKHEQTPELFGGAGIYHHVAELGEDIPKAEARGITAESDLNLSSVFQDIFAATANPAAPITPAPELKPDNTPHLDNTPVLSA